MKKVVGYEGERGDKEVYDSRPRTLRLCRKGRESGKDWKDSGSFTGDSKGIWTDKEEG